MNKVLFDHPELETAVVNCGAYNLLFKGVHVIQYEYTNPSTYAKMLGIQYLLPSGFDPSVKNNRAVDPRVSKDGMTLTMSFNTPKEMHSIDALVNKSLPWIQDIADMERRKMPLTNLMGGFAHFRDSQGNLKYNVTIPLCCVCKRDIATYPQFYTNTKNNKFPAVVVNIELEVVIQSLKNILEDKKTHADFIDDGSDEGS